MPLILDTFNVLHTVGVLPPELAGLDVPGLATLIRRSRFRAERTTFVCDGLPAADLPAPGPLAPSAHAEPGRETSTETASDQFTVRYAGRSATADDLIREIVSASSAPRRLIVVSSDHSIQRHARKRRCMTLGSEEFLQQLADDAGTRRTAPAGFAARPLPPMMTPEQVEQWMSAFDIDERTVADIASRETAIEPERTSPPIARDDDARRAEVAEDPAAADAPAPTPPPLPDDIITQAEALWRREAAVRAARQQPAAPTGPDQPATPLDSSSLPLEDSLDMNAILPADGRTQPLRTRKDRHKPPPPGST